MQELNHSINDSESEVEPTSLAGAIEALLFVSPAALSVSQLASILDVSSREVNRSIDILDNQYKDPSEFRGIRLQRHSGRVELTTAPEAAKWIERLLGYEISVHLSKAALETLAIIAYKQPTTRPQIDEIRGVNSDGVIRNLLAKGLIYEIGRASTPGRPFLFSTSAEFLQYFGLSSLNDLPPLELDEINQGQEISEHNQLQDIENG